jgi:hypothetical protein
VTEGERNFSGAQRARWATTGGLADPLADTGQALWRHRLGQTEKVANLWDFEEANYDVHSLGSNEALVVDAAANDLLRINTNGDVDVLAVFPSEVATGIPMLKAIFGYGDKLWATEMALVPGSAAVVEID